MNPAKKHILIADSDEQALIALERLLENEGFETTTAWSTAETMDLMGRDAFDLLLVADHPPEINCEAVLRKAKEQGPQIPLVILEAKPRHPFAEPYLVNLGASKVVQKWRSQEVKDTVTGMLGTPQIASKTALMGH